MHTSSENGQKGIQARRSIRAHMCPGDSVKRAGLFIHHIQMAKKGPNGDQRLPWALVFCVLESQLTRPEYRTPDGSTTGLDPIELFWSFDPWIIRTHWHKSFHGPTLAKARERPDFNAYGACRRPNYRLDVPELHLRNVRTFVRHLRAEILVCCQQRTL